MENIYLHIIQLWLYIQALLAEDEKDDLMAERPRSVSESLDIELDNLSLEDKMSLIGEICGEFTVQQLRQVRELVDQKGVEKLEDAKAQVVEEMRQKLAELDLDFEEVMGVQRGRRRRVSLPPRYMSPTGETWSERGIPPQWIRDYEESGGNREDYLIKDEG